MSILVVCNSCRTRFQVSEKFAGRSGPCPKCKAVIQIPAKKSEVTIHGGEDFATGGRDAAGQLVLKPIARKETRLDPTMAAGVAGGALVVLLITWVAGSMFQQSLVVRLAGLLLIAPPLIIGAYSFLRDDELEPYRGKALLTRTAICSLAYVGLWAVFAYVASRGGVLTDELWRWLYVAPPFFVIGALAALACFDMDFGSGFMHYTFFVLVSMLLGWVAGLSLPGGASAPPVPPMPPMM